MTFISQFSLLYFCFGIYVIIGYINNLPAVIAWKFSDVYENILHLYPAIYRGLEPSFYFKFIPFS